MYNKISPLGIQASKGTNDDFFDTGKYSSVLEAWAADDYVQGDFVQDESNMVHIELKHTKNKDDKVYYTLQIQHFPLGLDIRDDNLACEAAYKLLDKYGS